MNALMKVPPAVIASARKSIAEGGMAAGVPETRFNVPVGPHKMFDGTTVALADVAETRRKVPGATVNDVVIATVGGARTEEHTSELQSLMRISYAVFCLKKKNN